MRGFGKIVVAVDPRASNTLVLDHLRQLIRAAPGPNILIKFVSVREPMAWFARLVLPNAEELESAALREECRRLEELAERLGAPGAEVRTRVLTGKPSIEISRAALGIEADLVMKAPSKGNGSNRSTDLQLLRLTPCPVWLHRADKAGVKPPRILAAVDPAPARDEADLLHLQAPDDQQRAALDDQILDMAALAAKVAQGELHVLHAWSVPGEELLHSEPLLSPRQVREFVEATERAHHLALDRLVNRHEHLVSAENVHFVKGGAADVLMEQVETLKISLLVMGTVVRTGLPGLLLGNTAETVSRGAECSILAVKPENFVSPVAAASA